MKTKPWTLIVLSLLHFAAPFGNLLMNALRNERTLEGQWFYWTHVLPQPLFLIQVLMPVISGICILICRRWSYLIYLGTIFVMFVANIYSFVFDMNLNSFLLVLFILAVDVLLVAFFVVPSIQQIYFDRRVRWWEANPRYDFRCEGLLNGQRANLQTISQGGLFVTQGPHCNEGDTVELQWNQDGLNYTLKGVVKYHLNRPGMTGMGVCFSHTSETSRLLKPLIAKLKAEGKILQERLPGPEDRFLPWLKRLLTSGEGLFPRLTL